MYDFDEIAHALYDISITPGNLMKEALLKKYGEELDGFKEVLQFIYDPYFTTGIGKKKLDKAYCYATREVSVDDIMAYLKANTTGDSFDVAMAYNFVYQDAADDVWQWAAEGLVTKDLQIGVNITTLNKVFGKAFIPKIGIMRGMLCPANAKGIYIATEKIDGNRRIIMNKETGVEIYTRSGHRDAGLPDIEKEVSEKLPKGYVYDCECVAIGDFSDNIALRQASASILNSGGQRRGVRALCFDMLPQEEYDNGRSELIAAARKLLLAYTMDDTASVDSIIEQGFFSTSATAYLMSLAKPASGLQFITALPILGFPTCKAEGEALAKPIWETGGEGVMMVEYRSPYEVNPNPRPTLLKIKATVEYKLRCTGVYQGEAGKKYENVLGGIYLSYTATNGKTYTVGCGSGFPDYLRADYWEHPEKITGKLVEVECFGESKNAAGEYSLNCPIFKRIVGEKE